MSARGGGCDSAGGRNNSNGRGGGRYHNRRNFYPQSEKAATSDGSIIVPMLRHGPNCNFEIFKKIIQLHADEQKYTYLGRIFLNYAYFVAEAIEAAVHFDPDDLLAGSILQIILNVEVDAYH
jgi:hypothetical protein